MYPPVRLDGSRPATPTALPRRMRPVICCCAGSSSSPWRSCGLRPQACPCPTAAECTGNAEGEPVLCRAGRSSFWLTWDGRMIPCGMMASPGHRCWNRGFPPPGGPSDGGGGDPPAAACAGCALRRHCNLCASSCFAGPATTTGSGLHLFADPHPLPDHPGEIRNGGLGHGKLKKELVLQDIAGDFVLIPAGTTVLEITACLPSTRWPPASGVAPARKRGRADRHTGGRSTTDRDTLDRDVAIPGQAAVAGHPLKNWPGRRLPAICLFSMRSFSWPRCAFPCGVPTIRSPSDLPLSPRTRRRGPVAPGGDVRLHEHVFGVDNAPLVEAVAVEQRPDLILLCGDMLNAYSASSQNSTELGGGALKIAPVYAWGQPRAGLSGGGDLPLEEARLGRELPCWTASGATWASTARPEGWEGSRLCLRALGDRNSCDRTGWTGGLPVPDRFSGYRAVHMVLSHRRTALHWVGPPHLEHRFGPRRLRPADG